MRLGTASWPGGQGPRLALVTHLPSDPSRLLDLNRIEHLRLAKLGEGRAEALAAELVPPDLQRLLESGARGLHRVKQALAYAEKWERRSGLPAELARPIEDVTLLACLPRPVRVRRWDGTDLDPARVRGPQATLASVPAPGLAWVGMAPGLAAGCCLALDEPAGPVLGAWLELEVAWDGSLGLSVGGKRRRIPLDTWRDLLPRDPLPGEVVLAPPPRLRVPAAQARAAIEVASPWERLRVHLGDKPEHPTLQ